MNRSSVQILLSVIAFVLQLVAAQLALRVVGRSETLEFGATAAALSALVISLGLISGILLAFLLVPAGSEGSAPRKGEFRTAWIVGALPLIGVIASLVFSADPRVFPFSFLRPGTMAFAEWAFWSPAPSIWLGLVIGWLIRRRGRIASPG